MKSLIGLDIGNSSLKVTEVIKKRGRIHLCGCGIKVIPKGASFEERVNLLKELCRENGLSRHKIKISLAGKDVITRYLIFPSMSKTTLARSLEFEHDKYIPFPLNDAAMDIDILEKTSNGKMGVLLVASKKTHIEEKTRLLKSAGLLPENISTDSLSLSKIFLEGPFWKNTSFVLLNIGSLVTNLCIISKKVPVFSRDINIGGENLTRSIADKMDIPLEKAEELKCEGKDVSLLNMVSLELNSLLNEMTLSIEYALKNYELGNIECTYLSGGSSKLNGLDKILEDCLNTKVSLWNPFLTLEKTKHFEILQEYYPELILSLGISLS